MNVNRIQVLPKLGYFLFGKKLQLPSFRDCLKERRTVQMLTVGREAAIEVQESLLALNKLRDEVDAEKSRAKWDNPGCEKDLEVCIRVKNNAWAIACITGGKELYMVLEKANETLLYASDAVEKFSNRYCSGAFSLD
ncbi:hypothetical protein V6N12_059932 [Hibiscus sabdariffa]|uniref:Uncharacterized protein n=1 Tax=Hibiscus sabdariffa TaxID=183260 RepID=A0ABR2D2Y1_9ROSI